MQRFLALFDLHYGRERRHGKTHELHDPAALAAVLGFAHDLKPTTIVLGGDILDCGPVSHHLKGQARALEGLRLLADMEGLRHEVLEPLERLGAQRLIYHVGNHEAWLEQFVDENPGVEGLVSLEKGLKLKAPVWELYQQGEVSKVGKLRFLHGDQIRSSQYPARWAVDTFERSVRFGHFHRAQLHTKVSPLDLKDVRTGMSVPALCRRDPNYGKGSPNGWAVGFLWGYIEEDGNFNDYLSFIVNSRFTANGKRYKG